MADRFGMRDALDALSGPPAAGWPAGIVHHGARVLVLVVFAVLMHLLFPVAPVPDFPILEKGMVSDKDIIAQVAFPIHKTDQQLNRERAEAAASVAPVFDYTPSAVDTMQARVHLFLGKLDSAVADGGGSTAVRARVHQIMGSYGLPTSDEAVDLVRGSRARAALSRSLLDAIKQELPAGVASAAELSEGASPQVRVRRGSTEQMVSRDSLLTAPRFYDRATRHLPWNAPPGVAELQRLALIRFFEPSIRLNRDATEAARERARRAVPVVKGEVMRGEKIVGAHEQIRDEELQRLRAYQDELTRLGEVQGGASARARTFGAILFDLLVLLVFGLLLFSYRPRTYHDFRHILVLSGLLMAVVAAAAIIDRSHAPVILIPIAFAALVAAALWDGRLALNLALIMAVLLSGQTPFLGITVLFTMVMGGAAAALSVRVVRRRAQTWVFVAIIAAAYLLAAISLGMLRSQSAHDVLWAGIWGTLNAVASALVAMGVLPLLELFTRITTDQTLLELGDMNRPLLKRLALEAPGTYAHSISVANLAEAAARAIDANPLLARVGAYYHDVGKIAKPQYFIENQPQGRNPHDRLKPATSAAIVRGHVQEGLRLADEYKLPDSVRAFVAEHHGTQPIGFFYKQARETNPDAELNPAEFAYPGPRPQSKETAITMLSDGVESAARVLQDPTPEHIRELVDRIVDGKIAQGQLDETSLTLGEISRIKEQFASLLTGMYHHRIDYPASQRPQAPEAHPVAATHHGASRGS